MQNTSWQTVIDLLPVATFVLQDGYVRLVNRKMLKQTGYSQEELCQKPFASFTCPRNKPLLWLEHIIENNCAEEYEFKLITAEEGIMVLRGSFSLTEYGGAPAILGQIIDITEYKQQEEALGQSEAKYQKVVNSLQEVLFEMDLTGKITFGNQRAYSFFGYTQTEFNRGIYAINSVVPEYREKFHTNIQKILRGEKVGISEYVLQRPDGTTFPAIIHTTLINHNGHPVGLRGIILDVSDRERADRILKLYRLLSEHARDIILFIRQADDRIIEANQAAVKTYGYDRDQLLSMQIQDLTASDRPPAQTSANDKGLFESINRRRDGSTFPVEVSAQSAVIGHEHLTMYVIRDITERKQAENQMKYLSLHDPLTGIYNRNYFEQSIQRLEKSTMPVGIIVCDVDGLKLVNDTLGHNQGDMLILLVTEVIKSSLRPADIMARIGGDEFIILMSGCTKPEVEHVCRYINQAVTAYNEKNLDLVLSISCGLAYGETGSGINNLIKTADSNMYREKLHRKHSSQEAIIKTLQRMLLTKNFPQDQPERLQHLVEQLARAINFPEYKTDDLFLLTRFHDLGKVGLSDDLLFKPASLTPGELTQIQQHCENGYRIAMAAPDLIHIADSILKHHEWWNGQGYPLGIKDEEIPLECRMLAIAVAYDAMISSRPYRPAGSHQAALEELTRCAGTQFDPQLVPIFINLF